MTDAPRPTERFERALAFASDAADGLGHSVVTCQHLLLALTKEQKGVASAVLSACDVKSGDVHAWLTETGLPHDRTAEGAMGMADEMRTVLNMALNVAVQREQRWLDTEHLLEALLVDSTSADDIFSALQADLTKIKATLVDYRQRAPEESNREEVTHAYRFTIETAWVLSQANQVAQESDAKVLTPIHLIVALLRVESVVQRVLVNQFNLTEETLSKHLPPPDPFNPNVGVKRIPLKPSTQRIIGYAIGEAWNRGHLAVKPLHLAVGLTVERNSALDLLAEYGASQAALMEAFESEMAPPVIR